MHKERVALLENSESIVFFIHGFMGSPIQFDDLIRTAQNQHFSCVAVLLPGHGASWRDFVSHGVESWETHLHNTIEYYSRGYKNIYLVGHSMGGLLALNASLQLKANICGLFLIAPPMKINYLNPKALLTKIKLLAYKKDHEIKAAYRNANSISGGPVWARLQVIKPFRQLYKLIRKTKSEINTVLKPVTIVFSKNDETVSLKSAQILKMGLRNVTPKVLILENSFHAYYMKEDWDSILNEFISFLKSN